ncbi:transposase [Paenibacillus alginolyticus]|uniref:transposase n=1 Tax=Paenibacillus alginolyticus TaxID=59839 RepID=UPI000424476C|nr:transposase [Paenibacillus alginolyticus]MCY9668514.1 transposase [Paenibacillus alginolyticus]
MKKHSIQNEDQSQVSLGDFGILVPQIESLPMLPSAAKGTASSSRIRYKDFGDLTLADFLWSQVDRLVDFSFANELCAYLYSPLGQRPYAPALKLKLHIVQAMENCSDRQIEVRLMFDMAIKRFLGVPLSFTGLDHSTLGLDRDRMGDQLIHACFHYVLAQTKARGLWGAKEDCWLVDSFHTEAYATRGSVREIKPIPGNEHDGELLKALVTSVITHHEVTPKLVSAASAYGYGHYRKRLKTTARIARNNKVEGYQHFFKTINCAECPIQAQCTTNKKGRSVFISDHHKLVEAAIIRNETEEGQTARRVRSKIERTNNELANHHELRRPHVRGRNKLRIMAKLKAMVINIKLIVKKLGHYHEDPFVRQKLRPRGIAVCAS